MARKFFRGEVCVGTGKEVYDPNTSRPVMNGALVFKMMDQSGLPLDIIRLELQERKMGFDLPNFILAAKRSKNFTKERLFNVLTADELDPAKYPDFKAKCKDLIDGLYDSEDADLNLGEDTWFKPVK